MILEFGSWKHKTETLTNAGSNGKWIPEEPIVFQCDVSEIESTRLCVKVMEENVILKDSIIGEVSESLATMLLMPGVKRELELHLTGPDGKKAGKIKLNIVFRKPSQVPVSRVQVANEAGRLPFSGKANPGTKTTSFSTQSVIAVDSLLQNILLNSGHSKRGFVPSLDPAGNRFSRSGDETALCGATATARNEHCGCFEIKSIEAHDLPNKEMFGENVSQCRLCVFLSLFSFRLSPSVCPIDLILCAVLFTPNSLILCAVATQVIEDSLSVCFVVCVLFVGPIRDARVRRLEA